MLDLLPHSGYTLYNDKPIKTQRKNLSYVEQKSNIDTTFPMKVIDCVILGIFPTLNPLQRPGKHAKQKAEEALKKVNMYDYRNRQISDLSGGQFQRILIARTIIQDADLVFLDEPTAGLDTQSRIAVWELIRALKRDGVAVVLTTHLMDEAEALADNVLIIDHGHEVAMGAPDELTQIAHSAGVFITSNKDVDEQAFENSVGSTIAAIRPLHYRINLEPTPEAIAKIASELERQEVLITQLETSHRNLEDVFLDITGRHLRS